MCGICGKFNFDRQSKIRPELIRQMIGSIRHRGPDGDGAYVSGQVGLGHCRLSIIDLSAGQQPLANEDSTVWIVFNGEIYNYQDLRRDLLARGHVFKTKSDTEVIVHLYEEYGEHCVEHLRGMFAFAIWDDRRKSLFLARDRIGIKPLYYRLSEQGISFASELKAILVDPEVTPEIDSSAIDRFLTYFYLPGEKTLFRGILKLPAGSYMIIKDGHASIRQYWDLQFVPRRIGLREAQEHLLAILDEAVRMHMISDVPVGFLLSGGVDSTAMLSLATAHTGQRLSSYTVGFEAPGVTDERPYARLAARAYGSEHHEMTLTSREFADFLPGYVWHMEEPVCEPPAVALFYVSKMAQERVKVLISGEGGDEAFGGYSNYRNVLWLERLKTMSGPFRGLLSPALHFLRSMPRMGWASKYHSMLGLPFESYYYSRTSSPFHFFNSQFPTLYSKDFALEVNKSESTRVSQAYLGRRGDDLVNRMLYVDSKTWLVDDLLLKADKMTMASSVELRVPLLDHKLLEFAASLPGNYKVRGFTTKYIAKKTLGKQIPKEILNRKKTGFPVPYEGWLRTDLSQWLKGILLDRGTSSRGYFDSKRVEWLIAENRRVGGYSKELFSLATLELLHREFLGLRTDTALTSMAPAV